MAAVDTHRAALATLPQDAWEAYLAAGSGLPGPAREPRAAALLARATASLAALPAARRRDDDVRTLRTALGCCWWVAVAADPGPGFDALEALAARAADADVAWVLRENLREARLQRAHAARTAALRAGLG